MPGRGTAEELGGLRVSELGEGFRKDRNPGGRSRLGVCICEIYVMETIIKRNQEKIKMEIVF